MSLLDNASLVLTPNAYKEGKLYSVIPSDGSGDFTFTRATSATRVNAEGLIETASVLGSELVTNGDFSDGSANWGNYIAGSSTIVFTDVATLNVDASNSNVGIYQENVFTSGKQYKIVLKMKASSSFDAEILETQQANGISTIGSVSLTTSYQNFTFYFTATGTNDIFIHRKFSAASANQSITIDNVSVKEAITNNVPRLDYSLGGCPNILLEPQRTNLMLQSSSFDSATWAKTRSTVTANATTSPSGVMDADTFTADGSSGVHQVTQSVSVTSGTTYTYSIYVKKDTNNFVQLGASSTIFGSNFLANFDLDNGVVGSVGSSTTASIQDVGNGWYRCIITGAATATTSGSISALIATSASSARAESNTLSTSVYLWGAQLEAGSYATSYIPTTTASVTRNQDLITRNNIYTNGLITAAGGTWFVEIRNNRVLTRDGVSNGLFLSSTSTGISGDTLGFQSAGGAARMSVFRRIGGTYAGLFTLTTDTAKVAIKWNGTTVDVFVDGVKEVSATAFSPTNMDFLVGNGADVPKYINQMALFPTPLTDDECIQLTTI
jgi:hypothetical protein